MYRRSSFRSSMTTDGFMVKRSTAAPKPTKEVAIIAAPAAALQPPSGPHCNPTKTTQRSHSYSHSHSHSRGDHAQPTLQPALGPHCNSTKTTQRSQSYSHGRGDHANDRQGLKAPVKKKAAAEPIIEFPVSPDADAILLGEGITNTYHPQHRMVHVNLPSPFFCMGCKEYGAGSRFTCQQCNFELHDFCALAPPVLKAHPLHSQHQLVFAPKPGKGGFLRSKCDVCGKSTKGYIFHCSACSFQLHPCCAMLSAKMTIPAHPHSLVILPATANTGSAGDMLCSECKRRRAGRVYQCTVCDYYLHAVCAKSMVNGLHANGIKGLEHEKPNKLGVAAKIASHVIVGFMGGIVEGIGEGLGEAFTQNFLKGKCDSNKGVGYQGM